MPRRKEPEATKASESVAARLLSKILGVPAADDIESVIGYYFDEGANNHMEDLLRHCRGLYSWVADVAGDVMNPRTQPLTEYLMSMAGHAYIVKDSARSSEDSIWLAVADPDTEVWRALRKTRCRGLFHSFQVGDEVSTVLAIQLSSCQP